MRQLWVGVLVVVLNLGLGGCSGGWFGRRPASPTGFGAQGNRLDPALSGNGRYLASVLEHRGRARVVLQEQPGGRVLPLRHLRGREPHSSPSLSWNGRYMAVLVQQGPRRVALLEDRLTGRLVRLALPANAAPVRLSLAPDASRLALQLVRQGRWQVEVLELGGVIEPDLPGGSPAVGGGTDSQNPSGGG
ncbi:Tol biopolymer transporter periplasmic protein [Cyanobium sp. LEGE 06143]|uniref:Tol biopolymer transporter periplasmic protein n=1 Tax=Cyanobium sp. LEGE 06143 TaxID=945727 RepID=UPI00351C8B16